MQPDRRVETIRVEWDENGCYLVIDTEEETYSFLVPDPKELYSRVRLEIEPWLREEKQRRREFDRRSRVDTDSHPYDLTDTKHPRHHEVRADTATKEEA